jgi:hypothetical protein
MPPDRERDLERELRELGPQIDYPATPDLANTVRQRLEEGNEGRTARPGWPTALSSRWAAAAAVLVLFLAIPILSPAARDALSGLFVAEQGTGGAAQGGAENGGAGGGTGDDAAGRGYPEAPVMQEDTGGDLPASASSASSGGSEDSADSQAMMEDTGGDLPGSGTPPQAEGALGQDLGLGKRVTLQEARARVGTVFLPSEIGKPDAVYATGPEGVVLVYRARSYLPPLGETGIGLILTELPGNVRAAYFPEDPRPYAGIEAVGVHGGRGYWAPAEGSAGPDRSGGLYANVLLWERDGRALRLESNLPREEVIRIAESVR